MTATFQALINKSNAFWQLGVDAQSSLIYGPHPHDAAADRLYYGMFLAVCAYASKFRGMSIDAPKRRVHQVVQALVQAVAQVHPEIQLCLSGYDRLLKARGKADYNDKHIEALDRETVIKPANAIRLAFIEAAQKDEDPYADVDFDLQRVEELLSK